jgi:hypothetical protein
MAPRPIPVAAKIPVFSRGTGNFFDFPLARARSWQKRRAESITCRVIPVATLIGNLRRPNRELNAPNRESSANASATVSPTAAAYQKRTRKSHIFASRRNAIRHESKGEQYRQTSPFLRRVSGSSISPDEAVFGSGRRLRSRSGLRCFNNDLLPYRIAAVKPSLLLVVDQLEFRLLTLWGRCAPADKSTGPARGRVKRQSPATIGQYTVAARVAGMAKTSDTLS